jgi:hypothetical protein
LRGKYETEEFFVYPRDIEGDDALVNWSLVESGVTNAGLAFHNSSLSKLLKRLGIKDGAKEGIELPTISLKGTEKLLEAGDSLSQDDFGEKLAAAQVYLSAGEDLFVEDLAVGSHPDYRLGVRIITRSPAQALMFRSLLVSSLISLDTISCLIYLTVVYSSTSSYQSICWS